MMNKIAMGLLVVIFVAGLAYTFAPAPTQALDTTTVAKIKSETAAVGAAFGESSTNALPNKIGQLIKVVLGVLGIILVVIIVYAGFLWMTAGGDSDKVTKAKDWLKNAIIGLVIVLLAYAIADFVVGKLLEATSGVEYTG